jgi:TonB-dependent receptor
MHKATFIPILILIIICSMGDIVLAAGSNIEGYVKDAKTGDVLPGANVIVVGTSIGAATNIDGKYVIQNVTSGTYKIRATYLGYQPEEFTVNIEEGLTLSQDFELQPVGVKEKEVVVTAQASGQNAAINQQLSSDKIVNVVSAAKIQELPDANAAESVGRLPGVSLIREGGEASQVVIRGLSPEYNEVTIDGVRIPGNVASNDPNTQYEGYGQSVDLSMISSSMLGGIEVTKAITPDMDAAVIGGVVNFDLREAKSTNGIAKVDLTVQGGYEDLQTKFGPFKFVGSVENRFLDNRLGIFVEASAENVNLGSNTFGGSYGLGTKILGQPNPTYISTLNLDDILRTRKRYGGTITIDYKIPDGKIDLMNFISNSNTGSTDRGISYDINGGVYYNGTTASKTYLNVITNLLDFQKSFSFINIHAKVSHSYTENHDPNDLYVGFREDNVTTLNHSLQYLNPQQIQPRVTVYDTANNLYSIENYNTFDRDREFTGSLDLLKNINFSNLVTSTLKFGGTYRYTARSHDYNQSDGVFDQGSASDLRADIIAAYPWLSEPPYNIKSGNQYIPITAFADPSFNYGTFLHGNYSMGTPVNVGMLWNLLNISKKYGTAQTYSYNDWASKTYDYSGHEYEDAGYAMYTLNIGPTLTLIPGVRYQDLTTSYTAPRGIETSTARTYYKATDTTVDESHGYWLPMVHLIYKPLSWLQVHLAYTNTLTYPSYRSIIPWLDVATGGAPSVTVNNYALKPGRSANYDVVLSAYNNDLGLFSVDGFLKRIDDLIIPVTSYIIDPSQYPMVPSSDITNGEAIYTYENNPYRVDDYGIELEWQTHFWYLPDPLSGLVLSVNFTHIFSSAKYPNINLVYHTPANPRTEQGYYTLVNAYYTDRLLDQPDDIANLALGYDYKDFSIRVSMIYKTDVFTGTDFWPELRSHTSKYVRWDLSVKQGLPWYGLQAYFDMNNINGEDDISIIQGAGFPNSEQDYGMTADLGLRWSL